MDFEKEIEKHLLWRSMVESLFNRNAKDYAIPAVIGQDHHCHLGQWIYSKKSASYANEPVFQKLCEVHENFHVVAGMILSMFRSGADATAKKKEAEFYRLSDEVILCLKELKSIDEQHGIKYLE